MPIIPITFGTQTDTGRFDYETGPYHLNAYVQGVKEARNPFPIYAHAGYTLLGAVTDGSDMRGAIAFDETTGYIMSGSQVVKITWDGTTFTQSAIGGITSTGQAIMDRNQAATPQVAIVVDGQKFYIENDTLTEITDADLPSPVSCAFLNQRMLYAIEDGRTFFSDVDAVQTIQSGSVFTAEGNADKLVRGVAHIQEYWAMGQKTIEVWRNTSSATTPFRRNTGAVIPKGCLARHSVASLDINLFWVADDQSVYMSQGYTPVKISNQSVEKSIRETTDKNTIRGFGFFLAGNAFYVLSGPDWTWQFNRATGRWFPRQSQGIDRWRASQYLSLNNQDIVGDYQNSNIYRISEDVYTENGEDLPVILRSPPIGDYPNQYIMDRVFFDFLPGIGLNSTNDWERNPEVGLRYSDDMGNTWSTQRFMPIGKLGQKGTRIEFNQLGTTGEAGRILELEISAPSKRVLVKAAFEGSQIQR